MFYDRIDAGQKLASSLEKYRNVPNAIVVALPRGGVVPGYIVSESLNLPLDIIMVKKIVHPLHREYAIGAVSLTGRIINGSKGVSRAYIERETETIRELLKERYEKYRGNRPPLSLKNKIVIVVDDGVATGKTLIASLELIRKEKPMKIIVAVPVGPTDTIEKIEQFADELICLESYDDFYAVGAYYRNFRQTTDEEVIELMEKADKMTSNRVIV